MSKTGLVTRSDESRYQIPACLYRSYRAEETSPPTVNGWVQDAYILYGGERGFSAIYADVIVPAAPLGSYTSGMNYYTFPGFEPLDGSNIVQPVLQYGPQCCGRGKLLGNGNLEL